jgi:predicted protein tyrosine phosphatase
MTTKLLFICSQNRWRSLTAETLAQGMEEKRHVERQLLNRPRHAAQTPR